MKFTILRCNGKTEEHEAPVRAVFSEIERLIGATVLDTVNLRDGRIMLVNDLGHGLGLADNPEATKLYHAVCRPGTTHRIVGDVAIATDSDFG